MGVNSNKVHAKCIKNIYENKHIYISLSKYGHFMPLKSDFSSTVVA